MRAGTTWPRGSFGKRKHGGDAKAKDFVAKLYDNVPVLDTGARGSSITFAQQPGRRVHLVGERGLPAGKGVRRQGRRVSTPRCRILAEPPVAVVDRNVDRKGTRAVAQEYLKFLYTEEGQDIIGKNLYRPAVSQKAQAKYAKQFPKLNLFTIDQAFGGWAKARQRALRRRRQLRPDLHAQAGEPLRPWKRRHRRMPLPSPGHQARRAALSSPPALGGVRLDVARRPRRSPCALAASPMATPSARTKRTSVMPKKPNTAFR